LGSLRIVFDGLFIVTFLLETLQVSSIFFCRVFHKERSTALGARLGHRFVPYGKGAAGITGAAIKEAPSL
jgi:hypothetical protein